MGSEARQQRRRRDGAAEGGDGRPERTCIVSRVRHDPAELIRFVLGPDGNVVPDLALRLPGRGVWVEVSRASVEKAARTGAFPRAFKEPACAPADLADVVDRLLARRLGERLSLAVKAGLVVTGFMKVDALVGKAAASVLVHAADAGSDGRGKLDRKLFAVLAGLQEETGRRMAVPVVDVLTSAELSLAIGRENVVHAALINGGAAKNFTREAERLRRYRSNAHGMAAASPPEGLDTDQA